MLCKQIIDNLETYFLKRIFNLIDNWLNTAVSKLQICLDLVE